MEKELSVKITIEVAGEFVIPIGKSINRKEHIVLVDRMSWLEVEELVARLTPEADPV